MIVQIGQHHSHQGKARSTVLAVIGPGYEAFGEGVPLRACPHPWKSEAASYWRYGWRWAWCDWMAQRKRLRRLGDYSAWPVDLPSRRHTLPG